VGVALVPFELTELIGLMVMLAGVVELMLVLA
jgi:hypothetical protein